MSVLHCADEKEKHVFLAASKSHCLSQVSTSTTKGHSLQRVDSRLHVLKSLVVCRIIVNVNRECTSEFIDAAFGIVMKETSEQVARAMAERLRRTPFRENKIWLLDRALSKNKLSRKVLGNALWLEDRGSDGLANLHGKSRWNKSS